MQEDNKKLEDVWYFWNHCFYNRVKPSRAVSIKKRGRRRKVLCHDCGKLILEEEMRRKVRSYSKGCKKSEIPINSPNSTYVCKECHKVRQDILIKEKEAYNLDAARKFQDSVEKFDDLMADCKFGSCDVLSAHHELFKEDDNRLRTDFLIGLIYGEESKQEYLKMVKEQTEDDNA